LNVLFVVNDLQHQVTLLFTAEFTVERNHTNVTSVTRHLVSHSHVINAYIHCDCSSHFNVDQFLYFSFYFRLIYYWL